MEEKILRVKCFNVLKEIRDIIENNNSSDELVKNHEYNHAIDVYQWLVLLYPDKDIGFHIAALGHDIERCIENEKVKSEDFESHRGFKEAHSENSVRILKEIMEKHDIPNEIIQRTLNMVIKHEFGGDKEAEIIKNVDSLGNVIWCERVIEKYANEKIGLTMKRMVEKLDEENRELIKHLHLKTKFLWDI